MKKESSYDLFTDVELINQLTKGDHAAYSEIYQRYHQLCISFAFKKLQDEDLTKDIVQDLFTKFWVKRETLNNKNNLPAYLITSLKNSIYSHFEHSNVASKYITSLTDFSNTGNIGHTDYLVREREWEKYIDVAIENLPVKMKKAFLLNKKENFTYAETAKRLNTSENNIQKHINGAIKILKTKLTIFL